MATQEEVRASIAAQAEHTHQLAQALLSAGYYPVAHRDGFRILHPAGDEPLYIHIQPWSRGYSIFVSDNPDDAGHDWRYVPERLKHMQHPVYTKRDVVGAHNVPIKAILYAVEAVAAQVNDLHNRRTSQHAADTARINQAFERRLNGRIVNARKPRPQVRTVRSS